MLDISINGDMYLLFVMTWFTISMIVDILRIIRHFIQAYKDKGKISTGRHVVSLDTILEDNDMTDSEKVGHLKGLLKILDEKE